MEVSYIVNHFWEGDKFSDPGWCYTGSFSSKEDVEKAIKDTKRIGFKKFQIQKITKEFIEI